MNKIKLYGAIACIAIVVVVLGVKFWWEFQGKGNKIHIEVDDKYVISLTSMLKRHSSLGLLNKEGMFREIDKDKHMDLASLEIGNDFSVISGHRKNNNRVITKEGRVFDLTYAGEEYGNGPGSTATYLGKEGVIFAALNLGTEKGEYWTGLTARTIEEVLFTKEINIYAEDIHQENEVIDVVGFGIGDEDESIAKMLRLDYKSQDIVEEHTFDQYYTLDGIISDEDHYYILALSNLLKTEYTIIKMDKKTLAIREEYTIDYDLESMYLYEEAIYVLGADGKIVKYNKNFEEMDRIKIQSDEDSFISYSLCYKGKLYIMSYYNVFDKFKNKFLQGRILEFDMDALQLLSETPLYLDNSLYYTAEMITFIPVEYFSH